MRRFFAEEIKSRDGSCSITGREAKHISKVLRMGPGDRFILMDRKGARFLARIESAGSKEVLVTLERPLPKPPPSPVEIILCQAMLKPGAMDYLIQKTSELGVDLISPFFSERTAVSLERQRLSNKMRHWREIAQSSAKQSDRGIPAEIGPALKFRELPAKWKSDDALKVILWEEEGSKDLKGLLKDRLPTPKFIGVIGPEGGFSNEEIEFARDAGFVSASLGNRVLRSETAAITMVAIVQYEWGDLGL